jgi:hypothetical protein
VGFHQHGSLGFTLFAENPMRTLASVLLLSLAACSFEPREPKELEGARVAVRAMLNDPESAQFTDLRVLENGTVCGYVNAKNRFGGYTGKAPFYLLAPNEPTRGMGWTVIGDNDAMARIVRDVCGY